MHRWATLMSRPNLVRVLALSAAVALLPTATGAMAGPQRTSAETRPVHTLSASWGTDNGVSCPRGSTNLDNLPVTFNSFIKRPSIQVTDFVIVRSDGTRVRPTCALQFPPDEKDEAQTVNLIGDFGDSVNGPIPVQVKVRGTLRGKAPGAMRWHRFSDLPPQRVSPLRAGPTIVDAWRIPARIYRNDQNRCEDGSRFVRVMWSNGLTSYPSGAEVGSAVTESYRAVFRSRDGRRRSITPSSVADLYDHSAAANADNMHDLCLDGVPRGARLTKVKIGAELIQDPNGDPNRTQRFQVAQSGAKSG